MLPVQSHIAWGFDGEKMRAVLIFLWLLAFSIQGRAAQPEFHGEILPFEIISAIRNYSFKDNMVAAQVSISVQGGSQPDWLATAAYVAEQAIIGDATFSVVEVYVPTPWGDKPPTRTKQLAKAYYSGPNPARSPWPDEQWSIMAQGHKPTLPDIEFDALTGELLGQMNPGDPERNADEADKKARQLIIRKYRLPTNWRSDEQLGAMDPEAVTVKRNQVIISDTANASSSLAALHDCLTTDGPGLWRGCQDASADYSFEPKLDGHPR